MRKVIPVGITLLFIGASVVSGYQIHSNLQPLNRGWLYVGGSGPGNYTSIQDAVDNATDGDTVFVFDESSPYIENILINTSLSLIGENKETTIINGSTNGSGENLTDYAGVRISADNVTVRGFTIQSCNFSGIYISSNCTIISDTILSNNYFCAIAMDLINMSGYSTITNNHIIYNGGGIWCSGQNNIIKGNVISQNNIGIVVSWSMSCNISYNIISQNTYGAFLVESYNTVMYRNNITNNDNGVFAMLTSADRILQNNFIDNNESALSSQGLFALIYAKHKGLISFPIRRNVWNENYWDRPRFLPYRSPGIIWFFIDWHPAQEPYDI